MQVERKSPKASCGSNAIVRSPIIITSLLLCKLTSSGIRLVQKLHDDVTEAKSFFLFSDNCADKEDFYHAILQAQEHHKDHTSGTTPPVPLKFETPDLVKLVQQLHASEENLHTRWINALIGRIFLALYKTSEVKNFIANKINKKIARVPKPALISSVQLQKVDMGSLPPFITNPKLKELTVDGDLVVEADVSYKGNFRIEISATVRIDLGARFKAREVTIVLATVLKKLDGHILIRIKPPPSNRLWMTFETPPRMELSLEPIVSSRQITYGVVLRAIESRIREVVNETLVLPNWDDMPFMDTIAQTIRGGIWEGEKNGILEHLPKIRSDDTSEGAMTDPESKDVDSQISISSTLESDGMGDSLSSSTDFKVSSVWPRKLRSTSSAAQGKLDSANASSDTLEARTPTSIRSLPISSPMRSPLGPITAANAGESSGDSAEDDGTSSLAASTKTTPLLESEKAHARGKSRELSPEEIATAAAAAAGATNMTKKQTLNQSLNSATAAARSWLASKQGPQTSRTNNPSGSKNSLINNNGSKAPEDHGLDTTTENAADKSPQVSKSHTEPMGRGHPLPPVGQPLPQPSKQEKRQTWTLPAASTFASLTKRKPAAGNPSLSERRSKEHLAPAPDHADARTTSQDLEEFFRRKSSNSSTNTNVGASTPEKPAHVRRKSSAASSTKSIPAPAPPLPKRRQRQPSLNLSGHSHVHGHGRRVSRDDGDEGVGMGMGEGLLVVEAPVAEGSVPNSPLEGEHEVDHEQEDTGGSESPLKDDGASGRASLRSNKSSERERGVT